MSTIPEIKNFTDLIQPFIGDRKYISYTSKLLNSAGENYGSLMLSIDINLEKNGKIEILNIIAKLCPLNPWLKRMFASEVTFKKEISFYMEMVPTLLEFQKEYKVPEERLLDIFPKCLNARLNLNQSEVVDDNAVLLLENLRVDGYKSMNRFDGFNLEEAELVLKDLAKYHAVPLGYKIKHPDLFKTKLLPMLNRVLIGKEMLENCEDQFLECFTRHLQLAETELNRVLAGIRKGFNFLKQFPPGNEQYATMVHCDFWINNTMLKLVGNKPIRNKMLDFQVSTYGAPASDVLFFLYTSVAQSVFQQHYESLLQVYHQTFVQCLQDFQLDIKPYTFESFMNEINYYGPLIAAQILIMYRAIYKVPMDEKPVNDIKLDSMFVDDGLGDLFKNRFTFTVNDFLERNWF